MSNRRPDVIAVVGATATGKSDLAVALAQRLGAEVVNADAMQLYRGMDIGTAKLPPSMRGGVPHHLLDVLDVTQEASVAAYQRHARDAVEEIVARAKVAILAGGSGLYVRAVIDRLQIPPTDPAVRARWESRLAQVGAGALHAHLGDVDPAAAAAILPTNARRIVRALEVIELTGRPFTAHLPQPAYLSPTVQIGLWLPRPLLDERIEKRVHGMWDAGLVDETLALREAGLDRGRTASKALGYAQVLQMLAGRITQSEAITSTVSATRRYARRQEAWFGRDQRVHRLTADATDVLDRALEICRNAAASYAEP